MTSVIAISLMLSCGSALNCVEFPKMDGGITRIQPEVKMVIQVADLKEFYLTVDDYGQKSLSIALNADAQSQFAQLTRDNVGQELALIVDGKVVSEPRITSPIEQGRIQVTAGADPKQPFWEKVPWMKERLNLKTAETKAESGRNIGIYVIAAIVLLGGSLVYAFGIKKRKA